MPREVLDHILDATRARRCGPDRWMGHCLAHNSQRNRDLSIRDTGDRILLHDFAGCPLDNILVALGLKISDLFADAPLPGGTRSIQKPRRPDRVAVAFQFELGALDRRLRANRIFDAAHKLDITTMTHDELEQALNSVAQAYADSERAELFEQVADDLRERDFTERISREQRRRIG